MPKTGLTIVDIMYTEVGFALTSKMAAARKVAQAGKNRSRISSEEKRPVSASFGAGDSGRFLMPLTTQCRPRRLRTTVAGAGLPVLFVIDVTHGVDRGGGTWL